MNDQLIVQFSTTAWFLEPPHRWVPPSGLLKLLRMRWENKFSWVIRKACHSPFSHMDFVLPGTEGYLLGSSNMGAGSPHVTGNPCGVAVRPSNYQPWGARRRMIIRTDKADAILTAAMTQLGKPFDNSALYQFIGKWPTRDWRDHGQWFCAELCLWATETGNYWNRKLIWPKNRGSPTDYLLLFLFDDNFVNWETFWEPVPGLQLDPGER